MGSLLAVTILLAPTLVHGQTVDSLITMAPRVLPPPVCLRDSSEALSRPETGYVGPTARSFIIPEFRGRIPRGSDVIVRSHVTVQGVVDSVVITGVPDSTYREAVRKAAFGARFRPARRDGCMVADWYELKFSVNRSE